MKIRLFIAIMMILITGCPSKKVNNGVSGTNEQTQPAPSAEPDQDPNASSPYIYILGNRFYFQGKEFAFKGVNYYPSVNSWRKMWEVWGTKPIDTELGLLEAIGVNTLRIFLDYHLFEKNRKYGDSSIMLARLDELLSILDKHHMKALVTPFVWGRGDLKTDKFHIQYIASRYKDDPRVFGWDISNELDHCWIDNPSERQAVQDWAAGIYAALKETDKNHIATAGDYGWYLGGRDDPYGGGIALDLTMMSVPPQAQDFICFHWYSHYFALDTALARLGETVSKPILVEELGLPTGGVEDSGKTWCLNENQVAEYYRGWMAAAEKHKAYVMPWCGFDYSPQTAPFAQNSVQLFFGLYAADYRLKANGEVFRSEASEAINLKTASLPIIKECRRKDK